MAQKNLAAAPGIAAGSVVAVYLCTIALMVVAKPLMLLQLNGGQLGCLLFCGLNTLAGYGELAGATQVSAIITPLTSRFVLIFSNLLALFWPAPFALPSLNLIGYSGVVVGAMCSAVGHRWWPRLNRRALVAVIKPSANKLWRGYHEVC